MNSHKISDLKQAESKDKFENLKSNLILEKIFANLPNRQLLKIIKKNKKIKKRINIDINDYKNYLETNTPTEIEIKPCKNKYGEFINNYDKDKSYFHIYFNNNKEEVKRNNFDENDNVKFIKIIIDYKIKSFYNLFYRCYCIESIYFKKFYRNNITNM